jgi:hypothetical protein
MPGGRIAPRPQVALVNLRHRSRGEKGAQFPPHRPAGMAAVPWVLLCAGGHSFGHPRQVRRSRRKWATQGHLTRREGFRLTRRAAQHVRLGFLLAFSVACMDDGLVWCGRDDTECGELANLIKKILRLAGAYCPGSEPRPGRPAAGFWAGLRGRRPGGRCAQMSMLVCTVYWTFVWTPKQVIVTGAKVVAVRAVGCWRGSGWQAAGRRRLGG